MSGTTVAMIAGALMISALTLVSATQAKQGCSDVPRGAVSSSFCVR
jgi:hypothetical protein